MTPTQTTGPGTGHKAAVVSALVAALLVPAAPGAPAAGTTTRVSVATGGGEAVRGTLTSFPSLSGDGRYVAFASNATNLVPADTNESTDVFVHDRQAGVTTRVSVATGGAQGNNASSAPAVSDDGRFVAFTSVATNLVTNDTNNQTDVFVHDRQTGATSRVSVVTGGAQGCGSTGQPSCASSLNPAISGDGRLVAFNSSATYLVPRDTNAVQDVFVHDRQTTTTSRVSVVTGGAQGCGSPGLPACGGSSTNPAISEDGRVVAFSSGSSYLLGPGVDTNARTDVFVHELATASTSRASVASGGAQANGDSGAPAINGDGTVVAFSSAASDLVAGDSNGVQDVFTHDRASGTTTRVSVAADGGQANGGSAFPSISADGRWVTFDSTAGNLVTGDTNGLSDAFLRDRAGGDTERVSVAGGGRQGDGGSFFPKVSDDGRYVGFSAEATNLVPADTNGTPDIFVHDRITLGRPAGGYRLVASDGGIFAFGDARFFGSTGNIRLNQPIVGMAPFPTGNGYWLVASDGGIFAFGDARFFGSTGALRLNRPVVGMAASPTGNGYWLVASDGGIFAFGDARFFGSTGNIRLNQPITAMAQSPTGNGYWLVASDGGIFAFGDARFFGSTGALRLNRPVVGMAASPTGNGYWLVASDGGIFAFGDARFLGSTGALRLNRPVVGMAASPTGNGYWLVASDGGIFAFGDARFFGSTGALRLNQPVMGMAAA